MSEVPMYGASVLSALEGLMLEKNQSYFENRIRSSVCLWWELEHTKGPHGRIRGGPRYRRGRALWVAREGPCIRSPLSSGVPYQHEE